VEIEVIVPVLDDPGASGTVRALQAQTGAGARADITLIASRLRLDEARAAYASEPRVRVVEAASEPFGVTLGETLRAGRSDHVAVVMPGQLLSPGALDAMIDALRRDPTADLACVDARPSTEMEDPYASVPSGFEWPDSTETVDVRERWWMARSSFEGSVVRRSALSVAIDDDASADDVARGMVLRIQHACSRVVFVAGHKVVLERPDEYMPRLAPRSGEIQWYQGPIDVLWPRWMGECRDDGRPSAFVQAAAVAAVAARFKANSGNLNRQVLRNGDLERFFGACSALLAEVDDGIIVSPRSVRVLALGSGLALTLYLIKRGTTEVEYSIGTGDAGDGSGHTCSGLLVDGRLLECAGDQNAQVALIDFDPTRGELIIDGRVGGLAWLGGANYAVRVTVAGSSGPRHDVDIPLEHREWYSLNKYFGVSATRSWAFRVRVPVPKDYRALEIAFVCDADKAAMDVSFSGHFSRIARYPRGSWWSFGRGYLCYQKRRLVVRPRSILGMIGREAVTVLSLLQGPRLLYRRGYMRMAALKRVAYWLTRPWFARTPRWFFVDKVYKAGDSAEYLFRYASGQSDGIAKDYVVDESSADYARLAADGYRPVRAGTLRHLLSFLNADLVFASNSTVCSLNGLKSWRSGPFKGLIHFDTVCVQHGLSVQNIAVAQNRLVDNTRVYLLASRVEKDNLSRPVYAYDDYPDALHLTGLPRYDGLVADDRRRILIHPTWRMQFATPVITHEGEARPYNPAFKDSAYFRVYSSLISNEELLACARETGYDITYVLHPIASSQVDDFPRNDHVEIIGASGPLDYEEVLSQASLMVTDYSGVQFDFAYMRKPVVYYHPGELPPHYEEGAFRYATMAFGEICEDEQRLVDLLCDYMRSGCRMKPEFSERVEDFFVHGDRHNCQRSYRAALDYMKVRQERR
jgi:CDP-glycerol glycerophosphotransferase (TagB/SpsB family)